MVTKFLREIITDQQIIIPDVQAIVFVRCRENANLAELLTDFDNIAKTQELQQLYTATKTAEGSLPRLARNVLAYLSQIGKVWIVLDNFESWMDQEQQIRNDELRIWLETALTDNHSVRLILTSQFRPQLSSNRLQNCLKQIPGIEEGLQKGLPASDALSYLRQDGSECGLDRADEARLLDFLQNTHSIPSAMESLIGYLNEVYPDITFEKLMRDEKLQAAFRTHDREAGGQHLIQLQLAALSPDARRVLSVLAVLGSDTPREALIPLKLDGQLPVVLNRLYKNRLVRFQQDSFGVTRYTVQPYIAQNEELPATALRSSEYADDLIRLGNQAGEAANHRLDRDLQKCAETIYRTLIEEGRFELRSELAKSLANKGLALQAQKDYPAAYSHLNEAVTLVEACVKVDGQHQFPRLLATITGLRDEVKNLMDEE